MNDRTNQSLTGWQRFYLVIVNYVVAVAAISTLIAVARGATVNWDRFASAWAQVALWLLSATGWVVSAIVAAAVASACLLAMRLIIVAPHRLLARWFRRRNSRTAPQRPMDGSRIAGDAAPSQYPPVGSRKVCFNDVPDPEDFFGAQEGTGVGTSTTEETGGQRPPVPPLPQLRRIPPGTRLLARSS